MTESEYIRNIKALWPCENTGGAELLRMVEEGIRAFPNSAKLHCVRGDLIQMSDDDENYRLEDALACYENAVAADPCCAEAHESIGYYCDVIIDDVERAETEFRRAIELGGSEASYIGLARVLAERGRSNQHILEFLDQCPFSHAPNVREIRAEIESGQWKPEDSA